MTTSGVSKAHIPYAGRFSSDKSYSGFRILLYLGGSKGYTEPNKSSTTKLSHPFPFASKKPTGD
jgi:hypothetical protein